MYVPFSCLEDLCRQVSFPTWRGETASWKPAATSPGAAEVPWDHPPCLARWQCTPVQPGTADGLHPCKVGMQGCKTNGLHPCMLCFAFGLHHCLHLACIWFASLPAFGLHLACMARLGLQRDAMQTKSCRLPPDRVAWSCDPQRFRGPSLLAFSCASAARRSDSCFCLV